MGASETPNDKERTVAKPIGLNIIVVGAGIAGLTAAISLRQAGHTVQIFEKSAFATETGAALGLTPNGVRVLHALGFSLERARARKLQAWDLVNAVSLEVMNSVDLSESEKQFGFAGYSVHRVDMHTELLRLAKEPGRGPGTVELHLATKVVGGDAEKGVVELADGTVRSADLIVAADGVHSVLRPLVTGSATTGAVHTGFSAFRFLIPTQKLLDDEKLAERLRWKTLGSSIFADPEDAVPERHMVWYDCQGGEVQNFVGIHPTSAIPVAKDGSNDYRDLELEHFQAYHDDVKRLITVAENISAWPLDIHPPLSSWTKGKILLIGDAAHPMLPFGGQGANQALEDAGALGCLFSDIQKMSDIPARLQIFEKIRINRASLIQTVSKVRIGKETDVQAELQQFVEPGGKVPTTFMERSIHAFSHDVMATTRAEMKAMGVSSV